jgi:hypothetical protein
LLLPTCQILSGGSDEPRIADPELFSKLQLRPPSRLVLKIVNNSAGEVGRFCREKDFFFAGAAPNLSCPAKKDAPASYELELQIHEIFRAEFRASRSRFDSSKRILN